MTAMALSLASEQNTTGVENARLHLQYSSHLDIEYRQSQPLSFVFTLKFFCFPYRNISPVPLMLGLLPCRQAGAVLHCMLAVLS